MTTESNETYAARAAVNTLAWLQDRTGNFHPIFFGGNLPDEVDAMFPLGMYERSSGKLSESVYERAYGLMFEVALKSRSESTLGNL